MPKKKILVADDETAIRQLVRKTLENDYIVIEAVDGADTLAKTISEKPDLILMDIMMPQLNGYQACFKIKSSPETQAIPVVIITGVDYELNKKLGQQYGASGYITKPFSIKKLKDAIRQWA